MAENTVLKSMNHLKLNDSETGKGIMDLPNEILVEIFSMLPQEDVLKNLAIVCKRFLAITRSHEIMPIIRIECHLLDQSLPRRIQDCLDLYPASKINLVTWETNYSDEKHLQHVSDSVKYMSIEFRMDRNEEPVLFQNLEYLSLRITHPPTPSDEYLIHLYWIKHPFTFWNNFPNLTHLMFDDQNNIHRVCH